MIVAPHPVIRGTLASMPSGGAGVFHTLRVMREAVNESKTDPRVIQAAVSLIFNTPQRDEWGEASAIFDYVRDSIRFVRDVHGIETLAAPWLTLIRRVGDCDDQAALLASLFEAVGYPTRFVMAAYTEPDAWEHVYLQVFVLGEWIDADPSDVFSLGETPPGALSIYIEGV